MKGGPGAQGLPGPRTGGATYVRWGRTTCPNVTGTMLVYKGRAAGSSWSHKGGGGNYQCVTEEPETFSFGPGTFDAAYIYGAEYEMFGNVPSASLPNHNHDVPCAVCYIAPRETVLMIPGRYTCPSGWTREYYGISCLNIIPTTGPPLSVWMWPLRPLLEDMLITMELSSTT